MARRGRNLVLLLELGNGLASSGSLGRGLSVVSLLVESDEQEQVRSEQDATEDGGTLGSRARAIGGPVGQVLGGGVRVARKVNDEQVDDELSDLQRRQILLPPDLVAGGGHEVVVIPGDKVASFSLSLISPKLRALQHSHEDVNSQVSNDGNP